MALPSLAMPRQLFAFAVAAASGDSTGQLSWRNRVAGILIRSVRSRLSKAFKDLKSVQDILNAW